MWRNLLCGGESGCTTSDQILNLHRRPRVNSTPLIWQLEIKSVILETKPRSPWLKLIRAPEVRELSHAGAGHRVSPEYTWTPSQWPFVSSSFLHKTPVSMLSFPPWHAYAQTSSFVLRPAQTALLESQRRSPFGWPDPVEREHLL